MRMARARSAVVVVVTGSLSGIGKAICEQLGGSAARVYGGSRSACTPKSCNYPKVDVTDDASVQNPRRDSDANAASMRRLPNR
jgi:NADP-dependent 3-hydroxy acid dehydrogenase YdfG